MERLHRLAETYGLELTDAMLQDFEQYLQLLLEWNQRMNLTAITEREQVTVKHFLDSLLLFQAVSLPERAELIDVGTGAGFPGLPAKIYRRDLHVTLLDSLRKRVCFLQQVSDVLGQDNCCLHGRAEEISRQQQHRERYDCVTARAVASLPVLCEYCLPFVKVSGCFVALKSREAEAECEQSRRAIELLGGDLECIRRLELPGGDVRALVVVRKISQTPAQYPRNAGKITKKPL